MMLSVSLEPYLHIMIMGDWVYNPDNSILNTYLSSFASSPPGVAGTKMGATETPFIDQLFLLFLFLWLKRRLFGPHLCTSTPGGELAKERREVAKSEAINGVKFKIVEMGGTSVKMMLQKFNPTATPGCDNGDCIACADSQLELTLFPSELLPIFISKSKYFRF